MITAAAVAASLAAPAAASAASVSVEGPDVVLSMKYVAAPGERNVVSASRADGPVDASAKPTARWTVKDEGAPLTAGAGCAQVNANTVTCFVGRAGALAYFDLADGDDEFTIDTSPVFVSAGAGDDEIRIVGAAGNGRSEIRGGDGNDLVDASVAGAVEVLGDAGGDLLTGSDQNDMLDGGDGIDEIRGNSGNDRIDGGGAADKILCGKGDDDRATLDFADRLLDPDTPTLALAAAAGPLEARRTQTAADADRASLKTDCERIVLPSGGPRTVGITLGAPGTALTGTTLLLGRRTTAKRSYTLQIRDTAGRLLGSGSLKLKRVNIKLTPRGVALLKPGARATVRLLTRPARSSGPGPKTKPGVQVDVTIPRESD